MQFRFRFSALELLMDMIFQLSSFYNSSKSKEFDTWRKGFNYDRIIFTRVVWTPKMIEPVDGTAWKVNEIVKYYWISNWLKKSSLWSFWGEKITWRSCTIELCCWQRVKFRSTSKRFDIDWEWKVSHVNISCVFILWVLSVGSIGLKIADLNFLQKAHSKEKRRKINEEDLCPRVQKPFNFSYPVFISLQLHHHHCAARVIVKVKTL